MTRGDNAPQLCLVVEASSASARETLRAAFGAASIAAVIFSPKTGRTLEAGTVAPLIAAAQEQLAAALVESDAQLARAANADGVHIPWSKEPLAVYTGVRKLLGERATIGADAGRSRHDAMQLGEAGADYVAFGIPPQVKDRATAVARRLELVAWWSEIFEVPVVAFDVETPAEAAELAAAGADFIAARVPIGQTGTDVQHWVREIATALAAASGVA